MNKPNCIYELIDPETNRTVYIGQTSNPTRRKKQHLSLNQNQSNTAYSMWKWEIFNKGLKPIFVVIEENIPADELNAREKFWIQHKTDQGFELLNRPVGHISRRDLIGQEKIKEALDFISSVRTHLAAWRTEWNLAASDRITKQIGRCETTLKSLAGELTEF